MADLKGDMEAEYNNRARVPEHPQLIAEWQSSAQAYRAACANAQLDLGYGADSRQIFDIFPKVAETGEQPRTAVFIHGGYWQALDKSFFSHMAKGLNAHGYDVVIANYRLCPQVAIADIIEDMRDLAARVYDLLRKPLLVYGHSAGGHLAAALMATDWAERGLPATLCDRAMPISGLFDLVPLVETSVNNALNMSEASARQAAPLDNSPPAAGRFIAVVGGAESDEYLRQSRTLVERWSGPNLSGVLDIQEGANHFTVINPLADPVSALTTALAELGA
ncbi:alpha/beta hydrolase [Roseibium sp.]|uniref:alpha/beta hydrolase n=1 Tax=Roseibium sp. TaxID=1936156 RepID=UPI003A9860DE